MGLFQKKTKAVPFYTLANRSVVLPKVVSISGPYKETNKMIISAAYGPGSKELEEGEIYSFAVHMQGVPKPYYFYAETVSGATTEMLRFRSALSEWLNRER